MTQALLTYNIFSDGNDCNYVLTNVESLAAEIPDHLSLLHHLHEGSDLSELCEGHLLHNWLPVSELQGSDRRVT